MKKSLYFNKICLPPAGWVLVCWNEKFIFSCRMQHNPSPPLFKKIWFGVPFLLISRFVFFGFALLSMGLAMHDENTKPVILFQAVLKPSNLIMYRLVLHSVWSLCFVLYLVLVKQVLIIFMIKLWSKQDSSRCVEATM